MGQTEFKMSDGPRPGTKMVEVWFASQFIGAIYPMDNGTFHILSKHRLTVETLTRSEGKDELETVLIVEGKPHSEFLVNIKPRGNYG